MRIATDNNFRTTGEILKANFSSINTQLSGFFEKLFKANEKSFDYI